MKRILADSGEFEVDAQDGLLLTAGDLERSTGWVMKPEGLCKGDVCVPMPQGALRGDRIDAPAFWRTLGHPVVSDDAGSVWVLGSGAPARNDALATLQAPDFELPDLSGVPRRLSALRGRKVFLATWASW